jgi:23S rRNA (guanosine2251-2'-O)-methyltransferase
MAELIYGRNPVLSALKGSRKIGEILLSATVKDQTIAVLCKKEGIKLTLTDNRHLDQLTRFANHQGVAAYLQDFAYESLASIISKTEKKDDALLLILDGIEDPVNFGSLIRTSSCFGVDAILICKNRQVQVTPAVVKIATGAEEFVPICQVTNISQSIMTLKEKGYWIVAADGGGDRFYDQIDYNGKIALIIGSEGRGAARLSLRDSDFVVRIPISGPITSLNASISGAIMLAEVTRYRRSHQKN